jgi:microcystin-dependent protein
MPQAPEYTPQANFSESEGSAGRSLISLAAVDNEFARIATTANALRANLALIQNDDGTLRDGVVTALALTADAIAAIASAVDTVQGPEGPQGPIGPTGPQGPVGATGPTGPEGPEGPDGPQGPQGYSFEPNVTSLLLSDRDAYDSEPAGFSFLALDAGAIYFRVGASGWTAPIPWGQGPQGPEGPAGPTGPQGPTGPEGGTTPGSITPASLSTGGPSWSTAGVLTVGAGPSASLDAATKGYVDTQIAAVAAVPSGVILMWSGSVASIPTGWRLCDGTNGTPDLRDRFIVGAGSSYAPGATGGSASVSIGTANLPSHSHTFSATSSSAGAHAHSGSTSADGAHTHTENAGSGEMGSTTAVQSNASYGTASGTVTATQTGSGGTHSHSISTSTASSHTHSVSGTTSSVGSGTALENRPPYYALAYIQKA